MVAKLLAGDSEASGGETRAKGKHRTEVTQGELGAGGQKMQVRLRANAFPQRLRLRRHPQKSFVRVFESVTICVAVSIVR
jgi:hypothetical protein